MYLNPRIISFLITRKGHLINRLHTSHNRSTAHRQHRCQHRSRHRLLNPNNIRAYHVNRILRGLKSVTVHATRTMKRNKTRHLNNRRIHTLRILTHTQVPRRRVNSRIAAFRRSLNSNQLRNRHHHDRITTQPNGTLNTKRRITLAHMLSIYTLTNSRLKRTMHPVIRRLTSMRHIPHKTLLGAVIHARISSRNAKIGLHNRHPKHTIKRHRSSRIVTIRRFNDNILRHRVHRLKGVQRVPSRFLPRQKVTHRTNRLRIQINNGSTRHLPAHMSNNTDRDCHVSHRVALFSSGAGCNRCAYCTMRYVCSFVNLHITTRNPSRQGKIPQPTSTHTKHRRIRRNLMRIIRQCTIRHRPCSSSNNRRISSSNHSNRSTTPHVRAANTPSNRTTSRHKRRQRQERRNRSRQRCNMRVPVPMGEILLQIIRISTIRVSKELPSKATLIKPALDQDHVKDKAALDKDQPNSRRKNQLEQQQLHLQDQLLKLTSVCMEIMVQQGLVHPNAVFELSTLAVLQLNHGVPKLTQAVIEQLQLLLQLYRVRILRNTFSSTIEHTTIHQ